VTFFVYIIFDGRAIHTTFTTSDDIFTKDMLKRMKKIHKIQRSKIKIMLTYMKQIRKMCILKAYSSQ